MTTPRDEAPPCQRPHARVCTVGRRLQQGPRLSFSVPTPFVCSSVCLMCMSPARTPPRRGVPVPGCWCSAGGWWWWNWILSGQSGISLYRIPLRSFEPAHREALFPQRAHSTLFWIKTRKLCDATGRVRRCLGTLQLAARPRIAPMVYPGGWGAPMALARCWERGVHLGAASLFLIQKEMNPSYGSAA